MSHREPCIVLIASSVAIAMSGCPRPVPAPGAAAGSRAPVSTLTDASPSSSTSAPAATAAAITTVSSASLGRGALFGVARALTEAQIDLASEVQPRLRGKETRELAGALLAEHRLALTDVTTVQTRLGGVAPENSELRQSLVREVTDVLVALAKTDDAGVDAAYLDAQASLHRRAVEVLDGLQASETDAQLRALLESLRALYAARLPALKELGGAAGGP